jgi:hypothetical protein
MYYFFSFAFPLFLSAKLRRKINPPRQSKKSQIPPGDHRASGWKKESKIMNKMINIK